MNHSRELRACAVQESLGVGIKKWRIFIADGTHKPEGNQEQNPEGIWGWIRDVLVHPKKELLSCAVQIMLHGKDFTEVSLWFGLTWKKKWYLENGQDILVQDVSWCRHSKQTLSPWEEKIVNYLLYNGILHQAEAAYQESKDEFSF